MKRLVLTWMLLLSLHAVVTAQTAEDALRYSRLFLTGTARSAGMAGAFGAVGADFSVVATNPAGIGLYQKSEITFTPMVHWDYTKSAYGRSETYDTKTNFALSTLGFVFNINPYQGTTGGLKSFQIGFGMNRLNDFNQRLFITGQSGKSSLLNSYTEELNLYPYTTPSLVDEYYPFDASLASRSNLIFYDSVTGLWNCDMPYGGVSQSKEVTTYGSMNEFDISFAGNVNDMLYFGITIGIPGIRYFEASRYREWDSGDSIPYFRGLTYDYSLETHGTGINVKGGVIYRPANWVRIGAAVHSPTWYGNMSDNWSSSMYAQYDSVFTDNIQYSPVGTYDYRLTTPFRAFGSLAFIIGSYGLISADYEYVNYSQARLNSSYDSYSDINQEIRNNYRSWGNVRAGTEWRIADFRVRGGFAWFSNPYNYGTPTSERWQVSGGVGYRGKYFFADIAYYWSKMKDSYYFYNADLVDPVINTSYDQAVMTTFGFRF